MSIYGKLFCETAVTKSQGLCTEQLFCVIFAIKKRSEKEIGKYKK
ncbi:hypothetical protein RUMTOR_02476 [[Ruminococcus] torques ATCC 27756]|uniref:Uncharacterized protein n=1 Tax=[Ruminococcus] torques ATCC 27756 TaxID=411460 RepID=A5KQD8_9FIRM|nr:hypothetical protein RUMTOR_02476 [[Ruminococcus] torques ATCC 27756]